MQNKQPHSSQTQNQEQNVQETSKAESQALLQQKKAQASVQIKNEVQQTMQKKQQNLKKGQDQSLAVENQPQNDQNQQQNQQNWTDATQSVADQDDIIIVDDQMLQQMDLDPDEYSAQEQSHQQQGQQDKQQQMDMHQLQTQFVKGKQSDQNWKLGPHTSFCTSVGISPDGQTICTGGGDDFMLCFKKLQGQWKKIYSVKHTQTVSKIQMSHDGRYAVSMTDNQVFCTDLNQMTDRKLDIEEPSDILCHPNGGVVLAAHGFTLSIFNLKGLDLYTSYTLDSPADLLALSDSGKQIAVACNNKLRIISPKTGQIVKSFGDFHKEQINILACRQNLVYSGCIGGRVYACNMLKGNVVGSIGDTMLPINCLLPYQNYLLVAPQGDGLHWFDLMKLTRIFTTPKNVSITDIVKLSHPNLFAISTLESQIHVVDRRTPQEPIKVFHAGNSVHRMISKGGNVLAACQDGYLRGFTLDL